MGETKIGLVLEGGGMRGVYTAGVLDAFLDAGLEFDGTLGVSAGQLPCGQFFIETARPGLPRQRQLP